VALSGSAALGESSAHLAAAAHRRRRGIAHRLSAHQWRLAYQRGGSLARRRSAALFGLIGGVSSALIAGLISLISLSISGIERRRCGSVSRRNIVTSRSSSSAA